MIVKIAGWTAVVVSVIILLASGAMRLASIVWGMGPVDAFEVRYLQHPRIALLHMIPGLLFLTLAPLQFVTRIRQRHLGLHRRLGWVLASCAAVSGVFALAAGFRLPAFGGVTTLTATVFFGAIFLFSLTKAIRHILRKEVRLHREWMIRTFALAMAVATIRIALGLFAALGGLEMEEVFGTAFWLGFGINLLVAEVWINHTRPRPIPGLPDERRRV